MGKQRKKNKLMQLIVLILLVLLMIVSFLVSFIPVGNAQEPEAEITTTSDGHLCIDDQVLVKFKPAVSESTAENTLEAMSSEALDTASNIVVADVPAGETVESFVDSLESLPNVEYAQPDYVYTLSRTTVNDTYAGDQWHLDTMGVYDAWDTTMGSSGIVVAVLDTGVDLNHPDLTGQIVDQTDVVDNDGNAQDDDGHGTHVAGIIGAAANNGQGVAGIAPGAKLMAVDVFGYYATSSGTVFGALTSEVIEGIDYAVTHGADVINMSLGGADYDSAFEDAVNDAVSAGVVVVAASGNGGENGSHYPSDFDSCISVIATDWNDVKTGYTNYGPDKDISAPGGDTNSDPNPDSLILSTYYDPTNGSSSYAYMDGTSMASPMVAGVVALMLSANPGLSVNDIKNILYDTAVDLSVPGRDDDYGYGRVNAAAAVAHAAGVPYTPVPVDGVTLNQAIYGMIIGETLELTASVTPFGASDKAVTFSSNNPSAASVSPTGLVTAVAAGDAVITATTDDGGFTATCSISVTAPSVPVTGITLDQPSATLITGDSLALHATVTPADATDKSLTLVSDTPSVAAVSQNGSDIVVNALGTGTAVISVITNDGGYTATCQITVKSRTIQSSVYQVDRVGLYLRDVRPDTSAAQLKANLLNAPEDIDILDAAGNVYTGEQTATGMPVQLSVHGDEVTDKLGIVIRGDTSGDGHISISDYTYVRLHILGLAPLSGAAEAAADADQNGAVSIADYTLIRLHILGLKSMY